MHADIAGADRAQHRVGQRMEADIGVGMADEGGVVRDFDAADENPVARPESVRVKPLPDAHIAPPRRDQPLGGGEVFRRRQLQIVLAAGDQQRGHAGRLGDCRIIGQLMPDGGAVGGEDRLEVKALRGLRAPQFGAVDGRLGWPRPSARLIVSRNGRQGIAAGPRSSPSITRSISAAIGKRPRPIMDQHTSRTMRRQGFEPEPHRILPGGAAGDRRQDRQAGDRAIEQRPVLGPDRRQHTADPRMPGQGRHRVAQHRDSGQRQILLGQVAAEPAAAAGRDNERIDRSHARN